MVRPDGVAGVEFDGKLTMMNGRLALNKTTTIIAVVHDAGTPMAFSSVFVTDSFLGLAITPKGCADGYPKAVGPCNGSDARVVSVDWSGSSNLGRHNISGRRAVVSATYSATQATSSVDTCAEQPTGAPAHASGALISQTFHVGSRDNAGYDSRRRDYHSAAPPSPFSLCFNWEGERASAI